MTSNIAQELRAAGDRALMKTRKQKHGYAVALSRQLAIRLANGLRRQFPAILPSATGAGQESNARTAKGVKKLDVNYSTVQLGLGLGVSIKTINFRDAGTKRYTKNYTRADGELRAEASDYHVRQPYAVMIAVIFLPADSCDDAVRDPSSFGQAVKIFRFRAGRLEAEGDPNLFERVFIGLYETEKDRFGDVVFFDVMSAPPKKGRPANVLSFEDLINEIRSTYDARNSPVFVWADDTPEVLSAPVVDPDQDEAEDES